MLDEKSTPNAEMRKCRNVEGSLVRVRHSRMTRMTRMRAARLCAAQAATCALGSWNTVAFSKPPALRSMVRPPAICRITSA